MQAPGIKNWGEIERRKESYYIWYICNIIYYVNNINSKTLFYNIYTNINLW